MSRMRTQPLKEIPEAQFLNWVFRAAGLKAKGMPRKREEFTPEIWDKLDASRPLALPWSKAVLSQQAVHVRRSLWGLDLKSPIVDIMDVAAAADGMIIVGELDLPGPKGLMVLYVGTEDNDIDVFDIDDGCNNCMVIPSWRVSCENVILSNGEEATDEEEVV